MKRILLTTALIAISTVHLFADPDEDLLTSKSITYTDRSGRTITEHHEIKTTPKVTVIPDYTYREHWQTIDWDNAGACNHVLTHRGYHLKGETKVHEVTEEGSMRTNGDNVSLKQLAAAAAKVTDSDQTLCGYIKAHGYAEVTPTMIDRLRQYMNDHGILQVSELGQ